MSVYRVEKPALFPGYFRLFVGTRFLSFVGSFERTLVPLLKLPRTPINQVLAFQFSLHPLHLVLQVLGSTS